MKSSVLPERFSSHEITNHWNFHGSLDEFMLIKCSVSSTQIEDVDIFHEESFELFVALWLLFLINLDPAIKSIFDLSHDPLTTCYL
jgi:hypothetical protein